MISPEFWQPDKVRILKELYPHVSTKSLAEFLGLNERQVFHKAYKMNLHKTEEYLKAQGGRNTLDDGVITVRVNKSGRPYKFIRIAEGKWIHYHRYIYEQAHGQIPKGKIVVFKNQDSMDCSLENLELITREENMKRNTINNYPESIKEVLIQLRKIKKLINDKK